MVDQYNISVSGGTWETKARRQKVKKQKESTWYYLGFVGQIGYTIAIPLALGAILGSYIDTNVGMYPKWTLGGIGLGFLVSALSFARVIQDVIKK